MAKSPTRKPAAGKWSQHVAETSDAMDIDEGTFQQADPMAIARSLKHAAETSHRKKAGPFQSAMSMLNFYINRAGHTLPAGQKKHLEDAKDALRELFGRETDED